MGRESRNYRDPPQPDINSPRPTHSTAAAKLYDPATNTWQATGAMTTPRSLQLAVLLQSGQVLVAGRNDIRTHSKALTTAQLYQP